MREADEKLGLLMSMRNGAGLTIFPDGNRWYASDNDLPPDITPDDSVRARRALPLPPNTLPDENLFINKGLMMLAETVANGDDEATMNIINKLALYQQKRATPNAISPSRTRIEILYNKFDAAGILFKVNLTVGFLAFAFFILGFITGKKKRIVGIITRLTCFMSAVALTAVIAGRWYIAEHVPLSNGYETMVFISLVLLVAALATALAAGRSNDLFPAVGLLLSGFTLLVASIGSMNPVITSLVPVLQSPWLSLHVSLIMISYALFAFMMFNGITALILHFVSSNSRDYIAKLQIISQIMLYPAIFTLTAGIFIGAVWANVSWGRYWGWDPKEVWALITMLVYGFAMHSGTLKIFRRAIFFHLYTILAFLTVIMTYFGVNMFFGGMHSYGG
jgi:cytochrome c-type biogenesis protein CcsB